MALHRRSVILALLAAPLARAAFAASPATSWSFPSIDGGTLDLADFRGGPVLVVNTASRCGSTPQYDGLQALWERYRDRGLTVFGVPSKSFGQELDSAAAVKDFCEVNFAIDFPMTGLVEVKGPAAHPFYVWAAEQGYAPRWNFYKLLLDGEGRIVAQFDTETEPDDPKLVAAIEALLPAD
jgi:glutathione peroxidase